METRDLSVEGAQTPEEQSASQVVDNAATADEEKTQQANPEALAESEMTQAIESEQELEVQEQECAEQHTKASLIEQAKAMLALDPADIQRESITRLRQLFALLTKAEVDKQRTEWAEQGNATEEFTPAVDPEENEFNELISQIRDKKNAWNAEQEASRLQNLNAKNEIIDKINALAEDTDNVNRTFPLYRELQDQFNAIGEVPPTDETNVWKRFQEAREHYSDNLKINKELRDYDFKKNLDSKILLIEEAVALEAETDIIVAFRRLQELHDKWRQIGPVAKELRDEIWQKFKDASAAINKKYQAFFEERKAREAANEAAKTELCERIEALDFSQLKAYADWDAMTKQVIELQAEWKKLGFAPRRSNNVLFARFRQRCDEFFGSKAAYFKSVKEGYNANLAKKTALVERAEALKDSTDWKKTADELVEMQKEWKTIGAVPKKYSDAIWKRFLAACDYFFAQKKAATSGQRNQELANLKAKKAIIEQLQQLNVEAEDAIDQMHKLQDQWQEIGHVPFRDKDKINDGYRNALNAIRQALNTSENRARMDRFESNLSSIEGDQGKLGRERERLARALESRRIEIRTYENNLGFLSSKSKSGESMVNVFRQKIEKLKEDIAQLEEKIHLIDSKLS